ncbi:hypothetical protein [Streptomyces sp. NPDC102462]|uniref:SCO4402 family protein n=1 Tax=Streptomyces sp. NPDC102462 TaxID=3366178 RepID=UPI0038234CE2
MSDDARLIANHRVHVVPVVLALANPPWQRDVWLDPSVFENMDHVFHTLFDDFCDADEPERYLGVSLRTEEEVALMRELGIALNTAAAEAPNDTDTECLQASVWPEVVAVAGRLAQVMVANDLRELAVLLDEEAVQDPCQVVRGTTGNTGDQDNGRQSPDTA